MPIDNFRNYSPRRPRTQPFSSAFDHLLVTIGQASTAVALLGLCSISTQRPRESNMKLDRKRYPVIRKLLQYFYGDNWNVNPVVEFLEFLERGLKNAFKPRLFFLPFQPTLFVFYMMLFCFMYETRAHYFVLPEVWSLWAHVKGYLIAIAIHPLFMFLAGRVLAPVLAAIRIERRAIMMKYYRRPRKRGQYSP